MSGLRRIEERLSAHLVLSSRSGRQGLHLDRPSRVSGVGIPPEIRAGESHLAQNGKAGGHGAAPPAPPREHRLLGGLALDGLLGATDADRDLARLALGGLGDADLERPRSNVAPDGLGIDALGSVSEREKEPKARSTRW